MHKILPAFSLALSVFFFMPGTAWTQELPSPASSERDAGEERDDATDTVTTEPDQGPIDTTAPFYRLTHVYEGLLSISERYATSGRNPRNKKDRVVEEMLSRAEARVRSAMDSYSSAADDFRLTHLRKVFRSLTQAEIVIALLARNRNIDSATRSSLREMAREMAVVGRDIASNIYDTAVRARANSYRLAAARRSIERGNSLLARGSYVPAISLYQGGFNAAANTIVFDPDVFVQNVRDNFESSSVGYAYAITVGGQLYAQGASGLARTAADLPVTPHSPTREQHLASVSKPLVAMAVLNLLDQKGLTPDAPITPWLPSGWNPDTGLMGTTFADLLRHRSRFKQRLNSLFLPPITVNGNTYAGLKEIAESTPNTLSKGFAYSNVNFAMMRVLVTRLLGFDPSDYPEDEREGLVTFVFNGFLETFYDQIDTNINCRDDEAVSTRYYNMPYGNETGWSLPSNYYATCGGYGIFASAQDLAKALAYFRFTDVLVSSKVKDEMNSRFLGWSRPTDGYPWGEGKFGVYRNHGGDWYTGGTPRKGLDTCIMDYNIPVQAVVLINSDGGNYGGGMGSYQCTALRDAFDNAWVAK